MNLRTRTFVFYTLCGALLFATGAHAQSVPSVITVQGYLSDTSTGSPVPAGGIYSMQFDVFDAAAGGNLVASAGPLNVTVTDGLYEAQLPLSPTEFTTPDRHLEITVDGELLTPRIRLVSVPFAFNAARADAVADDAIDVDALAAGAVTLEALGIVCAEGEILVYNVGSGWSCGTQGGSAPMICDAGTYAHCYTGPTGTQDVGVCQGGQSNCRADRTGFEICSGEVVPTTEDCANGLDDDCDGSTDCGDTDCATDPSCLPEICDDGVDNDGDGDIDCADADCAGDPGCSGCADNDGDGFTDASCGGSDCDDTNSSISPAATEVCDTIDNNCDGQVDEGGVCTSTCSNGVLDGDESDIDCGGSCPACVNGSTCITGTDCISGTCNGNVCGNSEICDDGVDNDSDGDIDCADADCAGDPACGGCADNDGDGFTDAMCGGTDCDDSDPNRYPGNLETCDGVDNDCDAGTSDGQDDALLNQPCDGSDTDLCDEGVFACTAGALTCSDNTGDTPEICDNGVDDDCDTAIDCADGDCVSDPACSVCPDNDSDGFTDASCGGSDCDDTNSSISPAATEVCDTIDNNCDGQVDEGGVCTSTCSNGVLDGDESDIDCGGSCPACVNGSMCITGTDCISGTCNGNVCGNSEICDDGVDNDSDGDIDCADADCAGDPACV